MVKFQPLIFKRKYKSFLPHKTYPKIKNQLNSIRIPLLLTLRSTIRHTTRATAFFIPKQNSSTQFLYGLWATTFRLKQNLISYKNLQFIQDFVPNRHLSANVKSLNPPKIKTKSFSLLFPENLLRILLFNLSQLNSDNNLILLNPKTFVGLENAMSIKLLPQDSKKILASKWNLKRLFRNIQLTGSLAGSRSFFSTVLIKNWAINKANAKNNFMGLHLLYHIRRVEDKLEFLNASGDKGRLIHYVGALTQLSNAKTNAKRLVSLKNITRKTKHRRIASWGIFSRKYVKLKLYYARFEPEQKFISNFKFNKISYNSNKNEKN